MMWEMWWLNGEFWRICQVEKGREGLRDGLAGLTGGIDYRHIVAY